MPLSFDQQPVGTAGNPVPALTNWTPAIGYMIAQNASIAAFFYYQLVLEVRRDDASGTLFAKLKQRRNGYSVDITNDTARAFFNLKRIVNSQLIETEFDSNYTIVTSRKSIHTVGHNDTDTIFSLSGDQELAKPQIIKIYVKAYQNYSEAANTSPIDITAGSIDTSIWFYAAAFPLEESREGSGSAFIQPSTKFDGYTMSSQNSKMLSDAPYLNDPAIASGGNRIINYVNTYDYHTLAFFNNEDEFESKAKFFEIIYYDSGGSIIGSNKLYIENKAANGGFDPTATSSSDYNKLLYFGCGPKNLEESQVDAYNGTDTTANLAAPSNYSGWVYYSVRACDRNNPTLDAHYFSVPYAFANQTASCKDYEMRRLAWVNSKGGWDYFNFKMKSTRTIDVTRNNYSTVLGVYGGQKYTYSNTQRGKKTRSVEAVQKETLNTDWMVEEQAQFLENLFMSKNVNMVKSAFTDYNYPVIITDTSFVKKTNANDRLKIQYTINIEYSNPVNTNS